MMISSMEEIKVFTYNYVEELRRKVEKDGDYSGYLKELFPFENKYPKGKSGVFLPEGFCLREPVDSQRFDLENSISLFENLSGMNPTIASDVRLWTYLVHVRFWSYMRNRWKVSDDKKDVVGRILERYHLKYLNIQSLTRNGIARLWWYVYLTVDPKRKDKYELTKVLLSRADLTVTLMERSLGSSQTIRTAVLEFLSENEEIRGNESLTRLLIKQLNLIGGVKNLSYIEKEELKALLSSIKSEVLD